MKGRTGKSLKVFKLIVGYNLLRNSLLTKLTFLKVSSIFALNRLQWSSAGTLFASVQPLDKKPPQTIVCRAHLWLNCND